MICIEMAKRYTVTAHLPTSVPLTKRTAKNDLRVDVDVSDQKGGTLVIGQGSVEWWPDTNSVNAHRVDWSKLIDMISDVPPKRSARKKR